MKKIIYVLLSTVAICSCLILGACGSSDNGDETTTPKQTTNATTEAATGEKEEQTTEDDSKVTYKVTVVDEEGKAIAGALVQLCKDTCVPMKTDANGVAEFKLAEDDYNVKFVTLPAGYAYSGTEEEFHFEDGKNELTIILKAE